MLSRRQPATVGLWRMLRPGCAGCCAAEWPTTMTFGELLQLELARCYLAEQPAAIDFRLVAQPTGSRQM